MLFLLLFILFAVTNAFRIRSIAPNIVLSASLSNADEKALNIPERLGRSLAFYSKAIPVFSSYKFLDFLIKLKKNVLNQKISDEEEEKLWSNLHDWGSNEITNIIKELKGFYVKTGQIISTRVDIFPWQYTTKLSMMQVCLNFNSIK